MADERDEIDGKVFAARAGRRLPVEVPALAKDAKGRSWRGTIHDLSQQGCCFRFDRGICPDEGAILGVQFAGLEALAAEVVWVNAAAMGPSQMGLLFMQPLYPAVMEDIARRMRRSQSSLGEEALQDLPDSSGRY